VYAKPELAIAVSSLVEKSADKPTNIGDILSIQVDPPTPAKRQDAVYENRQTPRVVARKNYLEQEARNQSLGRAGEELALEFEYQRLWRTGKKTLAERIEHVSKSQGDGLGFDILSFEPDGRERLVEVKTTRFGSLTPFFASTNEVKASDMRSAEYHVYRLFDFNENPQLFILNGSIRSTCTLEAVQYRAMPSFIED
jgi:hypothetical protein